MKHEKTITVKYPTVKQRESGVVYYIGKVPIAWYHRNLFDIQNRPWVATAFTEGTFKGNALRYCETEEMANAHCLAICEKFIESLCE